MKKRGNRILTAAFATIVVVGMILAGAAFFRTTSNAKRLDERNLRELARIGRGIENQVNNYPRILRGLDKEYGRTDEQDPDALREAVDLIPRLEIDTVSNCTGNRPLAGASLTLDRGSVSIGYCGHWSSNSNAFAFAKWPINSLRHLLQSDHFELLLIADSSGQVFLSAPPAGIRVYDLTSLDSPGDSAGEATAGRDVKPHSLGVSVIDDVTIAGLKYRLFLQPIRIRNPSPDLDAGGYTEWTLGGLIPSGAVRRESLALRPTVALALGFLVALGLLSIPFVRVWAMGPRERMRFGHVVSVVVSLTLLSGLVGLGLADLTYYVRLRDRVNSQLDDVAGQLSTNLDNEIQAVLKELDQRNQEFIDLILNIASLGTEVDDSTWNAVVDRLWDPERDSDLDDLMMKTGLNVGESEYPALLMLSWTDPAGHQVAKWTPRSSNTSRVSVSTRDYFLEHREGRGWRRVFAREVVPGSPYYVESIRSLTTGEYQAAISVPFCWGAPRSDGDGYDPGDNSDCSPESLGVSVILTELAALDQPLLPPGVEFALVDETGTSLFHSRHERNLEENFVEEVGADPRLRSALAARTQRGLDAVYRGRSSRLSVVPLSHRPLWLIAVLDRAQLGTVHFEAWFVGGALFLAFAIALLLWFAAVEKTAPRLPWVWPDRNYPEKHAAALAILAVFGIAMVVQVALADSSPPHWSSFVVPFQALGLGFVALTSHGSHSGSLRLARRVGWILAGSATVLLIVLHLRMPASRPLLVTQIIMTAVAVVLAQWSIHQADRRRDENESGPRWRRGRLEWTYLASMVLGLVIVGGLPGYLYYRLVFSEHLELLVKYHQVALASDVVERRPPLTVLCLDPGSDGSDTFDLAYQPVYNTCVEPLASNLESDSAAAAQPLRFQHTLHRSLTDRVPWLTEVSVGMRSLADSAVDRSWLREGNTLRLRQSPIEIRSSLPEGLSKANLPWLVTFFLALISTGWLVFWLGRRVFLIGIEDPRTVTLDSALSRSRRRQSLIVVCTRSTDRGLILERHGAGTLEYVDLIKVAEDTGGKPDLTVVDSATVCVDHFDHRFNDPAWNLALLSYLEDLAYSTGDDQLDVILLTSREPDQLLSSPPSGDDSALNVRRWKRLFGRFVKIAVADGTPAAAFEETLLADRDHRVNNEGSPIGKAREEDLDELYSVLREECACRERLHEVGKQMLSRPDFACLTPGGLRDHIREAADPYYAALWEVLGPDQRLVLAQIAGGAIVNPKCERSLRQLLARGLLERGPELRLMNETFTRFVRGVAPASAVADWERSGEPSTWQMIRVPLVIGWIAVALFLFWTQRQVLGDTLAFVGTAGVGLAGMIRLLTLFQRGPSAPEPTPPGN